jgi:hypothetical protein
VTLVFLEWLTEFDLGVWNFWEGFWSLVSVICLKFSGKGPCRGLSCLVVLGLGADIGVALCVENVLGAGFGDAGRLGGVLGLEYSLVGVGSLGIGARGF